MISLVGHTGFVGSNLTESFNFDHKYNSKNIKEAYGTNPELLVYSGLRAEKYLANLHPLKDLETIHEAIENIKLINPKRLVLISTVDVYKSPYEVDENSPISTDSLDAYGKNRRYLEEWVIQNFSSYNIIRLPGLYGKNLKKNFIYDLIHRIPFMLTEERIKQLADSNEEIYQNYTKKENGYYQCKELERSHRIKLREYFLGSEFSAINFTDSRSTYQFYNLKYLWDHINIAIENDIKVLNLATEPVSISELYSYIEGRSFNNELDKPIAQYNFKTIYEDRMKGKNGYIFSKEFIINDISEFVKSYEVY